MVWQRYLCEWVKLASTLKIVKLVSGQIPEGTDVETIMK